MAIAALSFQRRPVRRPESVRVSRPTGPPASRPTGLPPDLPPAVPPGLPSVVTGLPSVVPPGLPPIVPTDVPPADPPVSPLVRPDVRPPVVRKSPACLCYPCSGLEFVAETADGLDPVLTDLRPQPLHMDVHDPGVTAPAVVHTRSSSLSRDNRAGRRGELQQQPHLGRCQRHRLPGPPYLHALGVDLQVSEGENAADRVGPVAVPFAAPPLACPNRRSTARMRATSTAPSNGLVT